MEAAAAECVRVAVRCRPLNKLEISDGRKSIVEVDTSLQQAGASVRLKMLERVGIRSAKLQLQQYVHQV